MEAERDRVLPALLHFGTNRHLQRRKIEAVLPLLRCKGKHLRQTLTQDVSLNRVLIGKIRVIRRLPGVFFFFERVQPVK